MRVTFHIAIDREQWLRVYRGQARSVQVLADNGQTLQFPASALRSHVKHDGIFGHFEIEFDADCRLLAIEKLAQ